MAQKPLGIPRWRRIALPASIILNIFFVALIGGHVLRSRLSANESPEPLARALANVEASLPRKDAAAFGHVLVQDAPQYMAAAQQLAVARENLFQKIVAEHFDPEGARQALAAWRTSWNSFFDAFSGPLLDALAQVSPDGRRKLVEARRRRERNGMAPP